MKKINTTQSSKYLTNKVRFGGIGVWDIVCLSMYAFILTRLSALVNISIDIVQIVLVVTIPCLYALIVYKEKHLPQKWAYFKFYKIFKRTKKMNTRRWF